MQIGLHSSTESLPTPSVVLSAGHAIQLDCAVSFWYVPAGQSSHVWVRLLYWVPAGHSTQSWSINSSPSLHDGSDVTVVYSGRVSAPKTSP